MIFSASLPYLKSAHANIGKIHYKSRQWAHSHWKHQGKTEACPGEGISILTDGEKLVLMFQMYACLFKDKHLHSLRMSAACSWQCKYTNMKKKISPKAWLQVIRLEEVSEGKELKLYMNTEVSLGDVNLSLCSHASLSDGAMF